ncbi:MAG TPA: rhodanese-like domain-containing protein [Burkholderiaceae bacterium]|nr:rhodanese-like domain-containing protein [Burkholderiaceae bacterium]
MGLEAGVGMSQAIFERAAQRGRELGLPYAGAVTPQEAWALVSAQAAALVDVRTDEELYFVGRVPGARHVLWMGPVGVDAFIEELRRQVAPQTPVLMLCRSAARSHHAAAAAAAAGFEAAYNVLEGFEGKKDERHQRGHINGWRKHGLPWEQD